MKNRVNYILKKTVLLLLGFCGINCSAFCGEMIAMYGMPPNRIYGSGVVYGDIDGDGKNEAVEGIRYSYKIGKKAYSRLTNKDGRFTIQGYNFEEEVIVQFDDVDGIENGSFESQIISVDKISNLNVVFDVVLQKVEAKEIETGIGAEPEAEEIQAEIKEEPLLSSE